MNGEHACAVGPAGARRPAGAASQRGETLKAVFVAVLGVNGFAGAERETAAQDPDRLRLAADQVHLDAMTLAIVDRTMRERGSIEIASKFAIDAVEQIEIETRGNASLIVVGLVQHAIVFFEVDANYHTGVLAQNVAGCTQERAGFVRFEISDRRPRKDSDLGLACDRLRQCKRRGKIRRDRKHSEAGEVPPQRLGLVLEEISGNGP